MGSKPNYIIVGLFISIISLLFIFFLVWLYGYKGGENFKTYIFVTRYSINGLEVGSPVKYKGVPIGKVDEIYIDKHDQQLIKIKAKIKGNIKIKTDTIASLGFQGITGLAFISLEGGSLNAPEIKPINGEKFPIIELKTSKLQQLSKSIPLLVENSNKLLQKISNILIKLNIDKLNKVIDDTDKLLLTTRLQIESFNEIRKNLLLTLNKVSNDLDNFNKFINKSSLTANNINLTIKNINRLSKNLNKIMTESGNNLKDLKKLSDITIIRVNEDLKVLKKTLINLNKLIEKIKNEPSSFIYIKQKKLAPTERKK